MWNPPDPNDRSGWPDPNQGHGTGWTPPPASPYGTPPAGPPAGPYGTPPAVRYGTPPAGGFGGPPPGIGDGDPLVSPNYEGWWMRSFELFKRGWRPLLILQLIAFVVALPLTVYTAIFQGIVLPEWEDRINAQIDVGGPLALADFTPLIVHAVILVVGGIVALLFYWLVLLASFRVVATVAVGGEVSLGAALKHGLRRLLPMIGWQILGSLLVLIGICACILPGVYVIAVLLVMPAVVAFERGANGGAIDRSFRLFHGDLGTSAARVATMLGLYVVVALVVGVLAAVVELGTGTADQVGVVVAGAAVSSLLQVALQAAVTVCGVPLLVTTYADMRARVEPFSTAVMAEELSR